MRQRFWFETIYAILDRDGRTRYVGRTKKRLDQRVTDHRTSGSPVGNWIRNAAPGAIRVIAIEVVGDEISADRERRWIRVARRAKRDLFNVMPRDL